MPQILATCLFFNFAELCKVSARLDDIDIGHFIYTSPPFDVFYIFQSTKNSKTIGVPEGLEDTAF